jgi:hypothetical protein
MVFASKVKIAKTVFATAGGNPMQPRTRSAVLEDNVPWRNAQLAIGNAELHD